MWLLCRHDLGRVFLDQGKDVLIVYDDLTSHAGVQRALLLLRRPPGREAYPGDIFYLHSRLLERSTHLIDSRGWLTTALPIAETEAQNLSAYIPTNLISITDGQIYLSPFVSERDIAGSRCRPISLPGGRKDTTPCLRAVTSDLRLSYSQFEELEAFSRFSSRLDKETLAILERGRRVRELLKQPQYAPISVPEQIAVLLSLVSGAFDNSSIAEIHQDERAIQKILIKDFPHLGELIVQGGVLSDSDRQNILKRVSELISSRKQ
ncbi:MAG: hypothetical protein R3C11_00145 [Planctomycetaceae bacterium]